MSEISLVRKLAEVMAAVERIAKRGRNDFHGYDYATEADIAAAIRTELAQRHVMLIPKIENHERHDLGPNKKGEPRDPITILHMGFTFYDGDSGESITMPWIGSGQDGGDKGAYKAMTGGMKYFCLKAFLIPTGDDPERTNGRKADRAANNEAKAQQKAEAPKAAVISLQQRAQLVEAAKAGGWRTEDVQRLLAAKGFARSSAVTLDAFPAILDALKHGATVPVAPEVGRVAPEDSQVI